MKEKEIKTSHGVIRYVDSEKGNKTVVFIHGGFGDIQPATRLLNHLGEQYRIIAPLLPGHGSFDLSSSDTYFKIVETIREFLSKLGIENYVLLGHSFGGRLILDLASQQKSKAAFVISVSPLLTPIDQSLVATTTHLKNDYLADLRLNTSDSHGTQNLKTKLINLKNIWRIVASVPEFSPTQFSMPVQIIWGELDTVLPLKNSLKVILTLSNVKLDKYKGHHYWMFKDSNLKLVTNLIKQLNA